MVLAAAAVAASADGSSGGRFAMPWMCLERCGGNASTIQAALDDFKSHSGVLTAVSFEVSHVSRANTQPFLASLANPVDRSTTLGRTQPLCGTTSQMCFQLSRSLGCNHSPWYPATLIQRTSCMCPTRLQYKPADSHNVHSNLFYRFWLRDVFNNPKPFINDLVSEIRSNGYSGVNM